MNPIRHTISMLGVVLLVLCFVSCCWHASVSAHSCGPFCTCGAHFDDHLHPFAIGGSDHEPEPYRTRGSGWGTTSSTTYSGLGAPAIITWSVAPDGTTLPSAYVKSTGSSNGVNTPSDLISFLDDVHHSGASPGGSDLTQRDWWDLMNSAFERWDEVSGVTFNYESADDGSAIGSEPGVLGTRGDHRIGGHSFDGQTSPTILAYNYFPGNSDMVIDTDEINRWSNPTNNYRLFRNMLMHEIGHGLGLNHVESYDVNPNKAKFQFGTFLMEPTLAAGFDGPQFDDILGIHRLYGDKFEEDGSNDNYQTATVLGSILPGQTLSIGTDANDTSIDPEDVDFVSIDSNTDLDFFSFSIDSPQAVNLLLTPMGPTYDEGGQGSGNAGNQNPLDASSQGDLTLGLYDSSGTTFIEFSVDGGLGESEDISNLQLEAGNYFVRVGFGLTAGVNNSTQFYQLDIQVVPEPATWCLGGFGVLLFATKRRRRSA